AVRLDLGGRAGNGNAARPMRGCAGCPTSRRESEPAPFHDPGRRTAKLPPASGGDACRRLNARLHESGRPGSNRRRPAWEAFAALVGQGFFGGGSRNRITQYRSATPRFVILARTETADSPAGAFPSSRAPHRLWQDPGRVREVTKSEPRRDDRRARDANPEPSRDLSVRRRDPRGRHVGPLSFLRPPLARARSRPAHKTGGQDHMTYPAVTLMTLAALCVRSPASPLSPRGPRVGRGFAT